MNLFTILIVDDEAFVVDWLSSLLEAQEDLSIDIYRAYNPIKAMEIMEKTRIDLLISDIQMPYHTGFDLAEKVYSLWPNSKTILLTAYPDFSYAQQAIRQGVLGYVLKTSPDTEILHEIHAALSVIERESNQQALIYNIEKDLKEFQTQLNRQLFLRCINGYHTTPEEFQKNLKTLGFKIPGSGKAALIIGRPSQPSELHSRQMDILLRPYQIQRIAEHYLSPYTEHLVFEQYNKLLLGILQLKDSVNNSPTILSGSLELVQKACQETLHCGVSFLVSPQGTFRDISSFWFCGKNTLSQFDERDDFLFCFKQNERLHTEDIAETFRKQSFYQAMKRNLENGDREPFLSSLHEVCSYLSKNTNWHNNISLQIYFSLVLVFISYINQKNIAGQVAFHAGTGMLFRPWLSDSWADIEKNMFQMAETLLALRRDAHSRSANNMIKQVQEYIAEHITEDISLLDLSVLTGYSTTYLSKYYSDTTGATISDYIAELKLKKISELMLDENLNISDIASCVGFHSRTYFNNYVKRLTGMSPQQFRESLLKKQMY